MFVALNLEAAMVAEERTVAADVLKAMAHPIRLGVLEVLASEALMVGDR